ncbi:GntR family transcriptional regulator [Amycolatopsis acidicola]|uniref:GntR family transcriptional regulator n=1 Tax=Amycolatopsis acidicola TaxID=2596893 RepID=A0A5N0VCA9_9PSEU|nr:GntR family transcriptional regulator [Amycolatopsis acidicola]KAA9164009.1 GntR family transcriptional regulator [Amycolatopsis acidicola]
MESRAMMALRSFITSGDVEPGARLTEIDLSERLGVGRATLRTVLARLADEGLVVKKPYAGWHVIELDEQAVWEIWTLRGSFESLAGRLVVEHGDAAALDRIAAAHRTLVDACTEGDLNEISRRDFEFHRAVLVGSRNQRLIRHYDVVAHQVRMYIRVSNSEVAADPDDIVEQHRALAAAFAARDADRVFAEAWKHNESEGGRLLARRTALRENAG